MINRHKITNTNITPLYFNCSHTFFFFSLLSGSHVQPSPLSLSKTFLFLFSITLSPVTIRRRYSPDFAGGGSESISQVSLRSVLWWQMCEFQKVAAVEDKMQYTFPILPPPIQPIPWPPANTMTNLTQLLKDEAKLLFGVRGIKNNIY